MEHPNPPACNVFQPVLPSITAVFTVVQNLCHAHSHKHPAKSSPSRGTAYSRHTLTHKQPASTASVCTTGIIRSSAICFRSQGQSVMSPDTAQHLPVGVPVHASVQCNWDSKLPSLGPVGNKYIFCPQSHMLMAKEKVPQPTCNFLSIKKAPGTSNPFH